MSDWMPDGKLPDASTVNGAFLFLVGIILNQNISGEQAWRGVARLAQRIELRPQSLSEVPPAVVEQILRQPPSVHPFASAMARAVTDAAQIVCRQYGGDTRRLWQGVTNGDELISRLTGIRQIGRHKAEVAVFLLSSVLGELDVVAPVGVQLACPALTTYLG